MRGSQVGGGELRRYGRARIAELACIDDDADCKGVEHGNAACLRHRLTHYPLWHNPILEPHDTACRPQKRDMMLRRGRSLGLLLREDTEPSRLARRPPAKVRRLQLPPHALVVHQRGQGLGAPQAPPATRQRSKASDVATLELPTRNRLQAREHTSAQEESPTALSRKKAGAPSNNHSINSDGHVLKGDKGETIQM